MPDEVNLFALFGIIHSWNSLPQDVALVIGGHDSKGGLKKLVEGGSATPQI